MQSIGQRLPKSRPIGLINGCIEVFEINLIAWAPRGLLHPP